jgi:hypothetical protein
MVGRAQKSTTCGRNITANVNGAQGDLQKDTSNGDTQRFVFLRSLSTSVSCAVADFLLLQVTPKSLQEINGCSQGAETVFAGESS